MRPGTQHLTRRVGGAAAVFRSVFVFVFVFVFTLLPPLLYDGGGAAGAARNLCVLGFSVLGSHHPLRHFPRNGSGRSKAIKDCVPSD